MATRRKRRGSILPPSPPRGASPYRGASLRSLARVRGRKDPHTRKGKMRTIMYTQNFCKHWNLHLLKSRQQNDLEKDSASAVSGTPPCPPSPTPPCHDNATGMSHKVAPHDVSWPRQSYKFLGHTLLCLIQILLHACCASAVDISRGCLLSFHRVYEAHHLI